MSNGEYELKTLIEIYKKCITEYDETRDFFCIYLYDCNRGICHCAEAHELDIESKMWFYLTFSTTSWYYKAPFHLNDPLSIIEALEVRLTILKQLYQKYYA